MTISADSLNWVHESVVLLMLFAGIIVKFMLVDAKTNRALEKAYEAKADVDKLEKKIEEALRDINKKFSHIEMSLSKIEGKLEPRREIKGRD